MKSKLKLTLACYLYKLVICYVWRESEGYKPVSTFDLTCENSGSLYTLKAAVWVADLRVAASAPELW